MTRPALCVDLAGARCSLRAQPDARRQLDSIIRRAVADKHLVGLSVGVMQHGKVILAKGYGARTLGTSDAVTPRTMFAIGSVTKQFTCSALMILAEEKKLSLTDPVAKYYPRAHAGEGHHAPRPRRASLGVSRLLSARFRRQRDAEAGDGRRDHRPSTRRARSTSSRARASRTATRASSFSAA